MKWMLPSLLWLGRLWQSLSGKTPQWYRRLWKREFRSALAEREVAGRLQPKVRNPK